MTSLSTAAMPSGTVACVAHRSHSPHNRTIEFHHVIPVAWQLATPLGPDVAPPSPGRDPSGRGMLWDNRGEWLCPTGHRNVHDWIVLTMHELALLGSDDFTTALIKTRPRGHSNEFAIASEALTRFAPYGSLLALTKAGEWGQS